MAEAAAALQLHWFLPTGGDARDVLPGADDPHRRAPDLPYLAQVATACDALGFDGMLTPCGTGCEDAWVATASVIPLTKRLKFLVAFRPALLSPTLAAQMASTYQRLSDGRLLRVVDGREEELHPEALDRPLASPAAPLFNPADGQLYIADRGNRRIVQLDAAGNFTGQLVHRRITSLRGFALDEINGAIYAVSGQALVTAPLPR